MHTNNPLLDVEFARRQFPAFEEPSLQNIVFCENAGGSYTCLSVLERFKAYYHRLKVQPYYAYPASHEAGAWMDKAYVELARYLGVSEREICIGPSTSQNTYVLAQAIRPLLKDGDEIIVTNQDHEANSGVWRRLAEFGVTVREWQVEPGTGQLDPQALQSLIGPRTRLVAFPHCSNIVAQTNPVKSICNQLRNVGIISIVDGVSFAPHGFPDVAELDADVYLFSLYKTFGPHQGVMVVKNALQDRLVNQGHYFNADQSRKRLVPAGPDHAQVAAAQGVAEYFDLLDSHHGGLNDLQRPSRVRALLHQSEGMLIQPLLDWINQRRDLRLLGPTRASQRTATLSLVTPTEPTSLVSLLAEQGVMAAAGHFYSVRLLEAMSIPPSRGVLRLSFTHYNTVAEIHRVIYALEKALDRKSVS